MGALLLAGNELYKMTLLEKSSPLVATASSALDAARFDETLEVPLARVAGASEDIAVFDARSCELLASQVFGDREVGPSRGCGGTGLYAEGALHVSRNYKAARRTANGQISCGLVVPSASQIVEAEASACGPGPKGRICAGTGIAR